jgi:hypothetical protein
MRRGNGSFKGTPRADGDIFVKRLTLEGGNVSSTAGGVIAVATNVSSDLVRSGPAAEWASFAARYQQFRVRAVKIIMEPCFPASGTPVAATSAHGAMYVSDYIGTSVPGSAAQVLSDEGAVVTNTCKKIVYTVDWNRNPNAKLWNPTSAAIPAPNIYGISYCSDASSALAINTLFYALSFEWLVEFRGSQ